MPRAGVSTRERGCPAGRRARTGWAGRARVVGVLVAMASMLDVMGAGCAPAPQVRPAAPRVAALRPPEMAERGTTAPDGPVVMPGGSTDDARRAAASRLVESARAAIADGRNAAAADLLERAISLDANFADAYVLLGRLYLSNGDQDLALGFLEKAVQLGGNDQEYLGEIESLRGAALEGLGREEAAAHAYERALDVAPHNPRARAGLARLRGQATE